MSSKLQDIKQAVAAYTALQKDNTMTSLEFARKESDLAFDVITSVPDLLAIAAAAGEVVDEGELTRRTNDVRNLACWANLTDALAKLEGE